MSGNYGDLVRGWASCSCGWRTRDYSALEYQNILALWWAMVTRRNTHQLTHQEVNA